MITSFQMGGRRGHCSNRSEDAGRPGGWGFTTDDQRMGGSIGTVRGVFEFADQGVRCVQSRGVEPLGEHGAARTAAVGFDLK